VFEVRRSGVAAVVIGVDPHKLSATTAVLDERERCSAAAGSTPTGTPTGRCSRLLADRRDELAQGPATHDRVGRRRIVGVIALAGARTFSRAGR
jgi:hypothetical protein